MRVVKGGFDGGGYGVLVLLRDDRAVEVRLGSLHEEREELGGLRNASDMAPERSGMTSQIPSKLLSDAVD